MCQNLRSVDSSPSHCVIRHLIELVPCKLCGHKVVNTALFHNLRKRSRITEYIGKPQNTVIHTELFLKELLSVHKLTYQ